MCLLENFVWTYRLDIVFFSVCLAAATKIKRKKVFFPFLFSYSLCFACTLSWNGTYTRPRKNKNNNNNLERKKKRFAILCIWYYIHICLYTHSIASALTECSWWIEILATIEKNLIQTEYFRSYRKSEFPSCGKSLCVSVSQSHEEWEVSNWKETRQKTAAIEVTQNKRIKKKRRSIEEFFFYLIHRESDRKRRRERERECRKKVLVSEHLSYHINFLGETSEKLEKN